MVRNYKRKKGNCTYMDFEDEKLQAAVSEVRDKKLSL
jgi:hypothetical protein